MEGQVQIYFLCFQCATTPLRLLTSWRVIVIQAGWLGWISSFFLRKRNRKKIVKDLQKSKSNGKVFFWTGLSLPLFCVCVCVCAFSFRVKNPFPIPFVCFHFLFFSFTPELCLCNNTSWYISIVVVVCNNLFSIAQIGQWVHLCLCRSRWRPETID